MDCGRGTTEMGATGPVLRVRDGHVGSGAGVRRKIQKLLEKLCLPMKKLLPELKKWVKARNYPGFRRPLGVLERIAQDDEDHGTPSSGSVS